MRRERFGPFMVDVPETRRERVRGLRGRDALASRDGLLLRGCRSVHTFGMRFAIDMILLDRHDRVIGIVTMRPSRVLLPRRRLRHILEVAEGCGAAVASTPGRPPGP